MEERYRLCLEGTLSGLASFILADRFVLCCLVGDLLL
jgi:hypothetical protein